MSVLIITIKQSGGEAPVPLWPRVVASDRALSLGQIKLFDHSNVCKQMSDVLIELLMKRSNTYAKLNC